MTIAYNAALQAARAALAPSGYRVSGSEKGHHYRMIESLRHTVEPPAADVDLLQRMKKKRNQSDYEVAGAVTEREAEEMLELAQSIHQKVREWLAANHPDKVSS